MQGECPRHGGAGMCRRRRRRLPPALVPLSPQPSPRRPAHWPPVAGAGRKAEEVLTELRGAHQKYKYIEAEIVQRKKRLAFKQVRCWWGRQAGVQARRACRLLHCIDKQVARSSMCCHHQLPSSRHSGALSCIRCHHQLPGTRRSSALMCCALPLPCSPRFASAWMQLRCCWHSKMRASR